MQDRTEVLLTFRYDPCMKHAPESIRDGAQPFSQTYNLIAEILPELRPREKQTILCQCFEDGPETLLAPMRQISRGLGSYPTASSRPIPSNG